MLTITSYWAAIPLSALLAALPWLLIPLVSIIRASQSKSLRDESSTIPTDAPKVSVIVPARNEAKNIETCIRAVLATTYSNVEMIVVNDHSTDGTEQIARAIADTDPRVRIINNPDLPEGWFGKQWACQNGANTASGDILLFVDADTRLGPEAIVRAVNGIRRHKADLYTVMTGQEMHTFWERVLQPQVFLVLSLRYGGTELINKSKRVEDKIANGQFLMFPRQTYDAMGGHALVRSYVAEDLKFSQLYFQAGKRTVVVDGVHDVTTRMYTTLKEVVHGWRKNVYAGGRDAVPFGKLGQFLFPFALPAAPLFQLAPVVALLLGSLMLISTTGTIWAALCTTILLLYWLIGYIAAKQSPLYALTYPLGAAVTCYIMISAILRGNKVSWKGRDYTTSQLTPQSH